MARTHAKFVTSDLGSLLAIEQGGQILKNEAGSDINRMARASQAKDAGVHYTEVLIYGDGTITDSVSIGIATASASLSTYVGGDSESFGYRAGEGEIHTSGSSTETGLDTLSDGDIVGILVDVQADTCSWYLNGEFLVSVDITADKTWHLAVSLAGTDDADLRAFLNAGKRAFQHEDDRQAGWYTQATPIETIRLSSAPFMTASNDSPPNTAFDDALDASGFTVEREVSFWPSGETEAVANISELPVINTDGRYDDLITKDVRDVNIWVLRVEEGAAYSTAERVFTGVVDTVQSSGDGLLMVSLRDPIATLDEPLQRKYFLPNAEEAANEPLPITLGAVRTIQPVLTDESSNRYRISDTPISTLGDVRVKGEGLDPNAGTPEVVLTEDRMHIELLNPPEGKLTVEFSSLGNAATTGLTDLWGGIGDPFVRDSVDDPQGWDILGARTTADDPTMDPNFPWVDFDNDYLLESWMADSSLSLEKGKTYKLEFKFNDLPNQNSGNNGFCYISLALTASGGTLDRNRAVIDRMSLEEDVDHERVFTVPDDWPDNDLVPTFYYEPNNEDGASVSLEYLRMYEYPDAFSAVPLDGLTLEQYLKEILESRAGKSSGFWSSSDASVIDAATGYECGWVSDGNPTILDAMLAVTTAWGISYYADNDGVIRIARIQDPSDLSADHEASDYNLLASVEVDTDLAEGLTTAMAVRRNWDNLEQAEFDDTTFAEVNQSTRRTLMRRFQEVVTTGVDLPGMYQHASLAEPVEAAMDRPDDAQQEISRVCEIYSDPRWIYVIELPEPPGTTYRIGDVIELTYDQYGLSGGKKVMVLGEEHQIFDEWARLVVWG